MIGCQSNNETFQEEILTAEQIDTDGFKAFVKIIIMAGDINNLVTNPSKNKIKQSYNAVIYENIYESYLREWIAILDYTEEDKNKSYMHVHNLMTEYDNIINSVMREENLKSKCL